MAFRLDQLIGALSGAVADAQLQIRKTNIGELSRFFNNDGTPVEVKLRVPRLIPETGKKEMMELNVPIITLVNTGQMSIQEMQVTMNVDISELSEDTLKEGKLKEPIEKASAIQYEWRLPESKAPVAASTATTTKKPGEPGMAQITLKITTEEVPEGLARFKGHLNKLL